MGYPNQFPQNINPDIQVLVVKVPPKIVQLKKELLTQIKQKQENLLNK